MTVGGLGTAKGARHSRPLAPRTQYHHGGHLVAAWCSGGCWIYSRQWLPPKHDCPLSRPLLGLSGRPVAATIPLMRTVAALAIALALTACTRASGPPATAPPDTPIADRTAISPFDQLATIFPPRSTRDAPEFITFTDETETFSIRYPADWELASSLMGSLVEDADLTNLDPPLFLAAVPNADDPDTLVSVEVKTVPGGITADEYAESYLLGMKNELTSLSLSQRPARVGDLQGQIVELYAERSEDDPVLEGRIGIVWLFTSKPGAQVGWVIACGFDPRAPTDVAETCQLIVRSFRLLR